jgi:hypothetical protein
MLEKTPRLKTLTYDCYFPSTQRELDLETLRNGLRLVSCTLSELTLKYKVNYSVDYCWNPKVLVGSLGSLCSLTQLTHLDTSLFLLYTTVSPSNALPLAQILPPRLQQLRLNNNLWGASCLREWKEAHIMSLFTQFLDPKVWKSATPDFQELSLVMEYPRKWELRGWEQEQQIEIGRLCKEQGIRFTVWREERELKTHIASGKWTLLHSEIRLLALQDGIRA